MSRNAPMVSARFIYGSTTIHDGSATIHHGGATNAHDASKIGYGASTVQAGSATASSSCCVLDESGRIGAESGCQRYPDSSRMPMIYSYGATKNEPDATTVELRCRPRPKSTTIHPECFKWFKTVVALSWRFLNHQDSSHITTVLLRFMPMSLRCYYESCRYITV